MSRTIRIPVLSLMLLCTAAFSFVPPSPIHAQPVYTAIDLGSLNADKSSWGWDLNNTGQVVGYADAPNGLTIHAFLWENGGMTDLHTLGGTYSWAYGINDAGQITGYSFVDGLTLHGFFWEDGTMNDIGSLPGGRGTFSRGNDINADGLIVGVCHGTGPGWIVPYSGFIHDRGNPWGTGTDRWLEIPTFGGDESQALGVNDRGEVVGWARYAAPDPTAPRAFLFRHGQMFDIGTFGGNFSQAEAVNNGGVVVGWSSDTDGNFRAFRWEEGGTMVDLGDFGGPESWAYAINDRGMIVGKASLPDGTGHAFLIDEAGDMWDLNDLVPPGLDVVFHAARGINESGEIVTSGVFPDGRHHAYLLLPDARPVPGGRPSSAAR